MCWKLFQSELKSVLERLRGMDKALELQSKELERRLIGMNELREEFTKNLGKSASKDSFDGLVSRIVGLETLSDRVTKVETLPDRVTKLENRSFIWITVVVIFFTILQFILKFWGVAK